MEWVAIIISGDDGRGWLDILNWAQRVFVRSVGPLLCHRSLAYFYRELCLDACAKVGKLAQHSMLGTPHTTAARQVPPCPLLCKNFLLSLRDA